MRMWVLSTIWGRDSFVTAISTDEATITKFAEDDFKRRHKDKHLIWRTSPSGKIFAEDSVYGFMVYSKETAPFIDAKEAK